MKRATFSSLPPKKDEAPATLESKKESSDEKIPPIEILLKRRWLAVPPAVATTACIGSLYAFSLFSQPLSRALGVVHSSADDWTLSAVIPVFSTILAFHGLSAAVFGKWQERVGPRVSIFAGALCYGGGYLLGAVGASIHSLPLLILGYGVLAGTGVGLAYTPPMATLLRWFPDRRGLATGMALCGFGGGALITTPFAEALLAWGRRAPEYLGTLDQVPVITEAGRRFISSGDAMREVVVATASDLSSSGFAGLQQGVYIVGTGSTGVATTFGALGLGYFAIMALSAWAIRAPPPGFALPTTATTATVATNNVASAASSADVSYRRFPPPMTIMPSTSHVQPDTALKTVQFWQIWIQVACMATGGFALSSVAKTMMGDIFGAALPTIVTAGFTSTFVMAMSAANLGGRLGWGTFSDIAGRKRTFVAFSVLSIPLYLCMWWSASQISTHPSIVPLVVFYGSSLLAFSFFAGTYSTAPALEADLFGSKYVGAIHGRILTANTAAALVGPPVIGWLRGTSEMNAITDLASKVSPATFIDAFGAPISQLDELVKAKTVTIQSLLQILPPNTLDPTPYLYNSTMFTIITIMGFSSIAALSIVPVQSKFAEKEQI